jgi:hypothetical protein
MQREPTPTQPKAGPPSSKSLTRGAAAASPEPTTLYDTPASDALRNGDEADARMEQIQKILGHAAMHLLDRHGLVAEWVRHAEAKASILDQIVEKTKAGRPEGGITRAASGELPIPGKTLLGRRKYIERAIKIDGVWEEAKAAARAAGLSNIQCFLLEVAHEHSLEAQLTKIKEIAARRSVPRRKSNKSDQSGNASGDKLTNQDAVPNPEQVGTGDETLTAEEEAQLSILRSSWSVDKVLRRKQFENATAVTRGYFIRDDLLGNATTGEVAVTAPTHYETAGHDVTTPDEASRPLPQSSEED